MKMTGAMETSFKLALKKPPSLRTAEVNKSIVSSISSARLMLARKSQTVALVLPF